MPLKSADILFPVEPARGRGATAIITASRGANQPWILYGFFALFTLALLAGAPGLLRVAYPAAALAIGVYLYFRLPLHYLTFSLWLYLLTPFVRRLADYRIGAFVDGNTMLLAPPLVSLIAILTLRKIPRLANNDGWLVFVLLLGTISYGGLLGFATIPDYQMVIKALEGWLAPMLFAAHVYLNWKDLPAIQEQLEKTAFWGLMVVGSYGVIQFILAPPWDCLWLSAMEYDPASGPGVYGEPAPFSIRTFSTMNSHQPMAIVLIILAVIALTNGRRLYTFAVGVGMLPVLFSLARTAWLQALVSFFVLAVITRKLSYLKSMLGAAGILCLIGFALSFTSFGDTLHQRIDSFSDKGDDISVGARQAGYDKGLALAKRHPLGMGTGGMEAAYTPVIYEDFGPNDSALVELLVEFGVFGSCAFALALFISLRQIWIAFRRTDNPILAGILAIWAGLLVQSPLNSCLDGTHGVFAWLSLGLGLAIAKYPSHLAANELTPERMHAN